MRVRFRADYKVLWFYLAELGLHCHMRTLSSCGSGEDAGYSLLCDTWASHSCACLLLWSTTGSRCGGFSSCSTQVLVVAAFEFPRVTQPMSSRTQAQ